MFEFSKLEGKKEAGYLGDFVKKYLKKMLRFPIQCIICLSGAACLLDNRLQTAAAALSSLASAALVTRWPDGRQQRHPNPTSFAFCALLQLLAAQAGLVAAVRSSALVTHANTHTHTHARPDLPRAAALQN